MADVHPEHLQTKKEVQNLPRTRVLLKEPKDQMGMLN